jgi:hypothetical protein
MNREKTKKPRAGEAHVGAGPSLHPCACEVFALLEV